MRLIDADVLKERIRAALGIKSLAYLLPAEKAVVDQIDNEPTVYSWISVKDGKPPSIREPRYKDVFKPFLLYTKTDNSVYVGWYLGEDYRGIDCYISRTSMASYQYITKKITHWMPMPEPPKEE